MKTCYLDHEHRAIADLMGFRDGWIMTRINVPAVYRGRGLGSKLLEQIIADARAENAILYLQPRATPSPTAINPGLNQRNLRQWYERHGFCRMRGRGNRGLWRWRPESMRIGSRIDEKRENYDRLHAANVGQPTRKQGRHRPRLVR